jgi:hypothetical protein
MAIRHLIPPHRIEDAFHPRRVDLGLTDATIASGRLQARLGSTPLRRKRIVLAHTGKPWCRDGRKTVSVRRHLVTGG